MTDAPREHTILIVDDEPEILASLKRTLRSEPYAVEVTTSPREALARIGQGGVDLLISDIDMPEMSGVELVARVRGAHPSVVRLLLTGDASLESAMEAINSGEVLRYLTKPWTRNELRQTIRDALERLDELRRVAVADRATALRVRMLEELGKEHPGIRDFVLDDGVYTLSARRLGKLIGAVGDTELRAFFEPAATRINSRDKTSTL